ncbi:MAG: DUF5916 domain-containing protein [Candidatus Eremiobacteraeota bacterium]|nr:DUF5916 domain-containing protein [Candidatus Eremiobacteraeota bacterium]
MSVLVGIFLLAGAPAHAWVDHSARIAAIKTATAPPLDASLTDPIWQTALKLDNFYDYTAKAPAKLHTTAYVLYDAKYLYVGVKVQQAGVAMTATQNVDHAGVATDDHISVNLDTAGNGSRVYQFRANPKGIHDEFSSENARYAPDWVSLSKIFPNGDYNLLFVIPFSVIRGESSASQDWRFDVVRFIAASNDSYTWAYDSTMNSVGSSQYWPFLTDIRIAAAATRPQPHADIYGLLSAGSDHRQFQNGIGSFQNVDPRNYGIDLTYPLTNTLAFVGTANPDFSNVEQDQTTIAPQEFQRQYNEYRPFFAQGANFLGAIPDININSYQTLLYTPAIGIFNHGEKIEGTIGQNSIGMLNVGGSGFSDRALGYSYNRSDNSLGFGFQGVNAVFSDGRRDTAYGYGATTANPHSGALFVANFQADRGTEVSDPAQADSISIGGGVQNATWLALVDWKDIGAQFNPLIGYTQINDIRGPQGLVQYSGSGHKGAFVKSYQFTVVADKFLNRAGLTHEADVGASTNLTFNNNFTFRYGDGVSELRFGGVVLPFNSQSVAIGYKDGSPSPIDAGYSWGPFAGLYLQQFDSSASRQFGLYGVSFEYDGTVERATDQSASGTPGLDTQWLRRISLARAFDKTASLAIGLRAINGTGGFAAPGTNLAISYHKRFANLNELYFDYGTPADYQTLHRWIFKYVFHFGGATGT